MEITVGMTGEATALVEKEDTAQAVGVKKVLLGLPVGIAGVAGVVDVGQLGGGGVAERVRIAAHPESP